MAYRVFLSYNTPDEMVVIWRLQTLAAASGIRLDVPNSMQRSDWTAVTQMIDDADSVIAFLTQRETTQVKAELTYALSKNKPVIPIVEQGTPTESIEALLTKSHIPVFRLDPDQPGKMETQLAEFLKKEKYGKDARNAILAIAGTFAGLFLLDKLTED